MTSKLLFLSGMEIIKAFERGRGAGIIKFIKEVVMLKSATI